ncbi:penicillin-binding transpeptidase domain-containing protein [Acrocarpospora catenulata]|uniref:penicillin-binding transpeptidase domain-containing protein n=1 Tax=Acrocarpospora catenulata TaxID=2836182 RepID=UPI001BDAE16A|nr:penicillin-binding transpeptidase domain-containing protein [Acrocarpospora catenulata]
MRGRTIAIITTAAVLVAGGAAGGAWYLLHTRGTPQETAQRFTAAWSRGDLTAMKAELATPATTGFDAAYAELTKNLNATGVKITLGQVTPGQDDRASAAYTATATLKNIGEWTYDGTFDLTVADRHWKVDWTPKAVHPALDGNTHLKLKTTWPTRAAVTDAAGARIDGGNVGGSVQQLVGFLDKADDKDVKKLGPAYRRGQAVGRGGLQETFQRRLAGTPTTHILAGEQTLATIDGTDGKPLKTSLDLTIQQAAANAVTAVEKPTSLVAVRPSTGEILAVVNNVGGFNRALDGNYAPGSTFKTVTAVGLLANGLTSGEQVTCPKDANVGGLKIRNSDHAAYGNLTFLDSYAHSCNTTFAPLTKDHLSAAKLQATATALGFNQPLNIGVPATTASMPRATSDAELAAESFGQAKITTSPLIMATVAAAVADGTWRPPTLVPGLKQKATEQPLPDGVADQLRTMMRAVVTKGTAKAAGLPSGTHGKTGTAEFGTGDVLESHAWFHGFRGDLAFAVVVEGGGGGGKVAAPIAARFLNAL